MEYQVPQFIEIEDKLIGPLTMKQFIYLSGMVGLCIVFFMYLPFIFAILFAVPSIALGVSLSFYKLNGKPFIDIVEAGFNYYVGKKFMLWKYTPPTAAENQSAAAAAAAADLAARPVRGAPRLTRGKLSELAWSLDVPTNAEPVSRKTSV